MKIAPCSTNRYDEVLCIVEAIQIQDQKSNNRSDINWFPPLNWIKLSLYALALLAALVLLFLNVWLKGPAWLGHIAIIFIAIPYFYFFYCIFLAPLIAIWINRRPLKEYWSTPIAPIFHTVRVRADYYNHYYHRLLKQNIPDLEFVLLELKAESDAFTKRIGLLLGAIEKVGLIPGVLAMFYAFTKLGDSPNSWVVAVMIANPILLVLGITMHLQLMTLDRSITLIEKVIFDMPRDRSDD